MKLYYLSGACSLASHISLIEAGLPYQAFAVDRATKIASDGASLVAINPKGYVPALVLDNGEVLSENVAVLGCIAGFDKSRRLGPEPGTWPYCRLLEWLAFINSEVHKSFSPLFRPTTSDEAKAAARELLLKRYEFVENSLGDKPFLTGGDFTVADAYLYVTLSWCGRVNLDISHLPKLVAFHERCRMRPSVQQARREEGLAP